MNEEKPLNEENLVVLSTAPDREVARTLAAALVERKLAACVNLVPGLESHYWWEGEVQHDSEVLLICKTRREHLAEVSEVLVETHPYECPEVVALPIVGGYRNYLDWIAESVGRVD